MFIDGNAFSDCTRLVSVDIPASVVAIAPGAFWNCTSLTGVEIPASVISIGDEAFYGCNSLTSITVDPANPAYSSLGGVLFDKSQQTLIQFPACLGGNVKYYMVPGSVTSIGYGAFYSCSNLVNIFIPDSVTNIGDYAFQWCASLASVRLPANITSIGQDCFGFCRSLAGITIPNSVTSIGGGAFEFCVSLAGLNIPAGVTNIGDDAFTGDRLTEVTIPDSVTTMGAYVFYGCINLTNVSLPANITSIGEGCLDYCPGLTQISIPNSVASIGDYAFWDCTSLTNVTLSANLTSIGNNAFEYCFSLTNITLPNSVTTIGDYAFYYCSLTSVTFPPGLTSLGEDAFSDCIKLADVCFQGNAPPDSGNAFYGNPFQVEPVTVFYLYGTTGWGSSFGCAPTEPRLAPGFDYAASNGVISITGYTGTNSAVVIPNTLFGLPVTGIAARAFANVSHLISVSLGTNITSIGDGAFAATGLESINIGANVTAIGNEVFMDCTSLTNITVSPANPAYSSVNGVLYDQAQLNLIQYPAGMSGSYCIPAGVTNLGAYSFAYSGLTGVTIPGSVTGIEWNAFYGCYGLASVSIPASVTSIGNEAFADCASLTNIAVDAANPAYSSVDGALLDKGQTTLLQFPAGLTNLMTFIGVTSVGEGALAGCVNLTAVAIPEGIQFIGDPVFSDCTNLTSVSIPASVTNIELNAFANCTRLTNITVAAANADYSSLDGVLFDKAQAKLIQFPAGLGGNFAVPSTASAIGEDAFAGCASLVSVSIHGNVTNIGAAAFAYCASLTNITVDPANPDYSSAGGVLFDKDETTLMAYPGGLAGGYTVPGSVTNIADEAFAGCGLTTVVLDASLAALGDAAFADCPRLTTVYFLGNAPTIDFGTAFDDDNNSVSVYYLPGTAGWSSGTFGGVPALLWNPQQLNPGQAAGLFTFNIAGPARAQIVVEACTNLARPTWLPVATNQLDANGNSTFTDSQSGNYLDTVKQ